MTTNTTTYNYMLGLWPEKCALQIFIIRHVSRSRSKAKVSQFLLIVMSTACVWVVCECVSECVCAKCSNKPHIALSKSRHSCPHVDERTHCQPDNATLYLCTVILAAGLRGEGTGNAPPMIQNGSQLLLGKFNPFCSSVSNQVNNIRVSTSNRLILLPMSTDCLTRLDNEHGKIWNKIVVIW